MRLLIPMILASALSAQAQEKLEVPEGAQVRGVQAMGSGCPQGSFSATISPDGDAFSLILDQYIAESTRQQKLDRKNCQVKVSIAVPEGFQFSVASADYRGFANVEGGSFVTHQTGYSFDGSRAPEDRIGFHGGSHALNIETFRGPFQDNYYIHNEIDPRQARWSPCREKEFHTLFISTTLTARTVNPRSPSSAMITLDSIDGQVQSQKFKFNWRACGSRIRKPRDPREPRDPRAPRSPQKPNPPGHHQPGRPGFR